MYERFTDRARKVMQLSQQEAQRFNHEYVGTEHVLLGLIKEGSGVAANVLKNLDVDLRKVRMEVEKIVQPGPDMVNMGKLPQTPRTKKVMEYSIEEARNLSHNYVGTEHLLLGLLREEEGVACQILSNLGLKVEDVREEIMVLLTGSVCKEELEAMKKTESESAYYAMVIDRIKDVCNKMNPKDAFEQIVAIMAVAKQGASEHVWKISVSEKDVKDIEKLGGEPLGDTL